MKRIMLVMQGVGRSLKMERKFATTTKKKGQIKSKCYKLQNKNKRAAANHKRKQSDNSSEASVAEDDYSDGELLIVSDGDSKPCEDWILNFACTIHMCPNRGLVFNI